MKWTLYFLALALSLPGYVEEKPMATQAGEALQPYADKTYQSFSQIVLEFMAGGSGPMAEGAKRNLEIREQKQKQANPSQLRPVKDCIKPNNVIDDDVQECVLGDREKTW